jgi:hypothetical protein
VRRAAVLLTALLAASTTACSIGTRLVADNSDLADYRAFRVAAHRGARLARARAYLGHHPNGAFVAEVRAAFGAEEPLLFAAAQRSRSDAIEYLVDLPDGPHAPAVKALLESFDASAAQVETLRLLAEWRRTQALLDDATERRHRFTDRLLDAVGAMVDPAVYGSDLEHAPAPLARFLTGGVPHTYGPRPTRRDETHRFLLPTPNGYVVRSASFELSVKLARGRVAEARVWGPDLFVRWTEADTAALVDAASAPARAEAARHVAEVLGGAIEAVAPESRCAAAVGDPEIILSRSCDGWTVIATMGAFAGAPDVIYVTRAP